MNIVKRIGLFLVGTMILALGINLANIARLGIAVYDAFVLNLAEVSGMSFGTMSITMGVVLVIVQFLISSKWQMKYLVQLAIALLFSSILDFFMYTVFAGIYVDSFVLQVVFFILANITICLGIAMVLSARLQSFPLETTMNLIHQKYHFPISNIKYSFDGLWLVLAIVIGLLDSLADLHIGLGTLVMLSLHGWLIDLFYRLLSKYFI
ncbi:MAG: hypothetical protein IKL88_02225 [Erysipelotrichales bacterium]|nr:hypothetical protein [Erysipelotrichales bacterium]